MLAMLAGGTQIQTVRGVGYRIGPVAGSSEDGNVAPAVAAEA
jgi:hypothetical protein